MADLRDALLQLLAERMGEAPVQPPPLQLLRGATRIGPKHPLTEDLPLGREDQGTQTMMDVIGMADPSRGRALLPLGHAARNPIKRAIQHAALRQQAKQFPKNMSQAITGFTEKYPRLASLITDINPVPAGKQHRTLGAIGPELGNVDDVGNVLFVNPLIRSKNLARNVMRHEGTHMAQNVRLTDRVRQKLGRLQQHFKETQQLGTGTHARRSQAEAMNRLTNYQTSPAATDPMGFHHTQDLGTYGYWKAPHEVAARKTVMLGKLPKWLPGRQKIADALVKSPDAYDVLEGSANPALLWRMHRAKRFATPGDLNK